MKQIKKSVIIGLMAALVVIFAACGGEGESSDIDEIEAITGDKPDAVLTVGIWEDGKSSYKVYGENGKKLPKELHDYAIGSITKTMSGSLIAKEVYEGKMELDSPISKYLDIREVEGEYVPTLKELVTHRSGLKDQWEEAIEKNPEATFSREELIDTFTAQKLANKNYEAYYSNFGTALAATAAAQIEGGSYESVMNKYIKEDLGLKATTVGGDGDLENYWPWQSGDEMVSTGAVISNVEDLLEYGRQHMKEEKPYFAATHKPLADFGDGYDIGYFWLIDRDNPVIFHNGEVAMEDDYGKEVGFQSFLGFSKEKDRVVVVLSNEIARDNEDNDYSTLLGYRLLLED